MKESKIKMENGRTLVIRAYDESGVFISVIELDGSETSCVGTSETLLDALYFIADKGYFERWGVGNRELIYLCAKAIDDILL